MTGKEKLLTLLSQNLFLRTIELYHGIGYNYPLIDLVRKGTIGCIIVNDTNYYFLPQNYSKLPDWMRKGNLQEADHIVKPVISYGKSILADCIGYIWKGNIAYPVFESRKDVEIVWPKVRQQRERVIPTEPYHIRYYLRHREKILAQRRERYRKEENKLKYYVPNRIMVGIVGERILKEMGYTI